MVKVVCGSFCIALLTP
ncbi:hypothetical protein CGJ89_22300 [Vibrio parahaemolyticus]|nr:hypothetical protein CGJ89_22300 [Vibrio parahaemolyticus]